MMAALHQNLHTAQRGQFLQLSLHFFALRT